MELISVIVPVYNVEEYLLRCVTSIQNQSYKNLEIILVDDESPDRCPQMCDELALEDPRIKVLHKKNGGLGFARNSGLDVATGEYVTFIDSDDWISIDHVENLYSAIIRNSADIAIGGHTNVKIDGEGTPCPCKEGLYIGEDITNNILLPLFGPDVTHSNDVQVDSSSCMNLYRRELICQNSIRFISEKYAVGEDLYFNIDCMNFASRVVFVDEVGYFYYQNNSSISRKYDPNRFVRTLNCYKTLYEKVVQYNLRDKIEYRVDRTFLMKIRLLIRLIVLTDHFNYKEKLEEIRRILNHEQVQGVLSCYPIHTFSILMRVFFSLMRRKNSLGVYYLMRFREFARKQILLRKILKVVGIGK